MQQDSDQRRRWHLDKTISITHLVTTLTLALSASWYIIGMDKRIEVQQEQIRQMQSILRDGDAPLRRDIDRMQTDIRAIDAKLDRLIFRDKK